MQTNTPLMLSRRSEIDPFIVMDVMRRANQLESEGSRIVHMEVGQPNTPAPKAAIEAARRAMSQKRLGYTNALGIPELRQRIAQHYHDCYELSLSPNRVIVTTGSSAGFVLAFLAAFDQGARVALPAPGYPCYRHILTALGVTPVELDVDAERRWMPDVDQLNKASQISKLDGLLLASPSNPTGTMLTHDRLEAIVAYCRNNRITFISDEIYHGLTYDKPAETALSLSNEVIVINSFSKYFSMTGWRIGWMVVPEEAVRSIERIAQNLYISAPTVSQFAALGAFDATSELEAYKAIYRSNRKTLLETLPRIGFNRLAPTDGAFYLYSDVSNLTNDSTTFCRRLLEEAGVAITPGLDFDAKRGNHFVRFSYAGSREDMTVGLERLETWLKTMLE